MALLNMTVLTRATTSTPGRFSTARPKKSASLSLYSPPSILFIDNFDSFTFNLVDEFEKRGCRVAVYRNSLGMAELEEVMRREDPSLVVLSPGPSHPRDAGICIPLIRRYAGRVPVFGVCLGHQCIIEAFGGKVGRAPCVVHGKPSNVVHDGTGIFRGVENPLQAGRYHSLCGTRVPSSLRVTASCEDVGVGAGIGGIGGGVGGVVMAVQHQRHLVIGVQFHPESILTPAGGKIIENILEMIS